MLVSAAGIEPATHALKELISPVFSTTSRLLRDYQTLADTNKADQPWVIAVGDLDEFQQSLPRTEGLEENRNRVGGGLFQRCPLRRPPARYEKKRPTQTSGRPNPKEVAIIALTGNGMVIQIY
jgi:hypothetical protein